MTIEPIKELKKDSCYELLFENRRIGKFRISEELVKYGLSSLMKQLFPMLFILKVEFNFLGWFEYTAYCKLFDEQGIGQDVPIYDIIFKKENNNNISISVKKTDLINFQQT